MLTNVALTAIVIALAANYAMYLTKNLTAFYVAKYTRETALVVAIIATIVAIWFR